MVSAVIVAAGRGTRMGPVRDKLFLEVGGFPIIAHTWRRFDRCSCVDHVVLVVREGWEDVFRDLASRCGLAKPHRFVLGGAERQDSVWNGLLSLPPDCEIVAIHDGARPCVTERLIIDTIRAARELGAAVAAQRMVDTVKQASQDLTIARHLDRNSLWAVQTPQTFRVEVIRRALVEARRLGLSFTDDTAACELIGQPVKLVESQSPNPKVTIPSDLPYLEAFWASDGER